MTDSPDVVGGDNETSSGGGFDDDNFYLDEWFDPFECASSSFFAVFTIPTVIMAFLLGRHHLRRGFKSSFQKLFFILMINDLLCVLMQMITLRLPSWGLFYFYNAITIGAVPSAMSYVMYTTGHMQVMGCLLLALNRASSVGMPRSYERLWKSYFPYILIGLFGIPQLFTFRSFFDGGSAFIKFAPAGYYISALSSFKQLQGLQLCIAGITLTSATFAANSYTGFKLAGHLKTMNASKRRTELRFFYLSLTTFVCQAVYTVCLYFIQFGKGNVKFVCLQLSPIVSDFNSLIPIYMLMFVSQDTRNILFPGKDGKQSVSAVGGSSILSVRDIQTSSPRFRHSMMTTTKC